MSKPVDIGLYPDDIALRVGRLVLANWQLEKKIEALEKRVDELEPPQGDAENA